ncbi:MAG: glutamine-synthetase adenylyltransferase [Pseudomonadota bacterium]
MTLADAITAVPVPFEPGRGDDVVAALPALPDRATELCHAIGATSPYLAGLLSKEADWLPEVFATSADDTFAHLLAALPSPEADPGAALRKVKGRVSLFIALADLGGVWPLEAVTGALTRFADHAVQLTAHHSLLRAAERGRLPGGKGIEVGTDLLGLCAIAMGKMGAFELNYSSDIDLIVVFDETKIDPDDFEEARAGFVRATRDMARLLSDITADGYVFRTDLRLRPDASVTPVALSMEAAERYYESVGRTWERAAHIKARAAAGDTEAGARYLERLSPFVWRKHLDFAAIEDAHDMRLKIRDAKGLHGDLAIPGHDLKLGRGGIREIEFFTQTRQLIAGGRDLSLRVPGTVKGLRVLAEAGWIGADAADQLTDDYREHRRIEHRLQMLRDAQTQTLPTSDEEFRRLACLSGYGDPEAMRAELKQRFGRVHTLTEGFFAPGEDRGGKADISDVHAETAARWLRFPALRSDRARARFKRLRPTLFERLDSAPRPEEAIAHFEDFLKGLPAGVQLFALFEANPHLVDLIVDITSISPALSRYLGRNAQVLDAVIGGDFFADWPGEDALTAELTRVMTRIGDYEHRLDAARRWMKEWHFRIGVHFLRGIIDADRAGQEYADLAGAVVRGLLPVVEAEFARKHGVPPGRGAVVVGMGSFGARRLTATSDLDLIVIYDGQGAESSDGRRPLPTRTYYARMTQALITALTAPMAEGRLYEVDMRLRPSGRQGPVATSWDAYRSYQRDEAWTWERLALTRARAVAGDPGFQSDFEAVRDELLAMGSDPGRIAGDVADMRRRLDEGKPRQGPWDIKDGPGGLRDIELVAQLATLTMGARDRDPATQLTHMSEVGWIDETACARLASVHSRAWRAQAAMRLLAEGGFDPEDAGLGGCRFLTETAQADTVDALADALVTESDVAANIVDVALKDARKG